MQNRNKRNALHFAALHAGTEVMDILASIDLCGLDVDAKDKDGHTPNACFMKCRNAYCAVTRTPFEVLVERQSWVRLMKSARGESDLLLDVIEPDEKVRNMSPNWWSADKGTVFVGSTSISSESESDDVFVDAEDGLGG